MGILSDIRQHAGLKEIWIDRNKLMMSLGIDLENAEYIVLNQLSPEEVADLLVKSLMWMETINEKVGTAKKFKMDEELERDRVFNDVVRKLMGIEDGLKVTEAKAAAKSHHEYVADSKRYNTLAAYVDYLSRLLDNLDKYHYAIKSRIDAARNIERKY